MPLNSPAASISVDFVESVPGTDGFFSHPWYPYDMYGSPIRYLFSINPSGTP